MPATTELPYAVIGATGQQGGAVVDALLTAGRPVRALVRDVGSDKSRALADRGVTPMRGDIDDADSLVSALRGVTALFVMTTFAGPKGTAGEVEHGQMIADAAARAGVPRVVYSSVGGAERSSEVPHFDSKRRVEEYFTDALPVSIVRPTFFMENFIRILAGGGNGEFVLRFPMPGTVPLQMVAVRDIGVVAAELLVDPTVINGNTIEIAGDALTGDEIASRIGAHLGMTGRFEATSLDSFGADEDRKAMFRWFADTPAYTADFAATRRVDPTVLNLDTWLKQCR